MFLSRSAFWGTLCILFFAGASAHSKNLNFTPHTKASDRVIYGVDDRKDVYAVDTVWQERADSTVALVMASQVQKTGAGYTLETDHYGSVWQLCSSEPFYHQTYASFCSASLIAPDIIMTAGHCVTTLSECQSYKYIFNYSHRSEGDDPSLLDDNDVYSCKELIHSQYTMADFALIRLDRKVTGHAPLPLNRAGSLKKGDSLVLIGNPAGLPTKVAAGATVLNANPKGYFIADTDSYGGNSGSAVFNGNTGLIEGILVRGSLDFVVSGGCYVSNYCNGLGDCRGEDVTRVEEVLKYLPSDISR